MHICGGLVGLQSGHVENVLVFKDVLEKPSVAIIQIFARFFEVQLGMERIKGKGTNNRGIGPKTIIKMGSIWPVSTSK